MNADVFGQSTIANPLFFDIAEESTMIHQTRGSDKPFFLQRLL